MVGGLLARLEALLDDLAELDVDTLGDGELHQMVIALSRCDTRLEAARCRLIGRWDRRQIWADNGSKPRSTDRWRVGTRRVSTRNAS